MKEMKHKAQGRKGGATMHQQGGINPIVGATVGAAVGGVVGAAAAVALSDKDTREKIKTAANNLKDQATQKMKDMQGKAQNVAEITKKEAQKQLAGKDGKKIK